MSVEQVFEPHANHAVPIEPWECRTTRLTTEWVAKGVAIVTVEGEIDAANADRLSTYALRVALQSDRLILDLSKLEFFGTDGFSTLHMLNVRCAKAGIRWAMVAGPAVARVLRICDPAGGLLVAGTVDAAVAAVNDEPRRLLQLVTH
jgi:anti-anti-sigma factor